MADCKDSKDVVEYLRNSPLIPQNAKGAVVLDVEAVLAADVVERPRWISVEERLPPYGDRILVTDGTGVWEGYLSFSSGFMRNTGMSIKDIYDTIVTHWMPLPEPPKGE